VVGECEYIAGLRKEAKINKERLQEALVKASLGPIRGIYTREVAMQVVRGELVDPIMGESLRNGKITFKGGLLAEGISKGVEYFKDREVAKKIKNLEARDREERMRRQVEALAKKEQGQYEYVGEPANILPDNIRNGKKSDKENFKEIVVKNKGDSVWSIFGNKPTQKQLEEFIEKNPYIAARGVVRDEKGNIINLTIRVGETILVPENIATSYKAGYTPAINRNKEGSDNSQGALDVCFDPNANNKYDSKYGNIFGARGTGTLNHNQDGIDTIEGFNIPREQKEIAKNQLIQAIKEFNNLSNEQKEKLSNLIQKSESGKSFSILDIFVADAQAAPLVVPAIGACISNPACVAGVMSLSTVTYYTLQNAISKTKEFIKDESYKSIKSGGSNDQNKQNIKQQPGSAAATGAPDPDDDFDFDPDDDGLKQYEKFKKQDGSGRYECEKPESPVWKKTENFKDQFRTNGLKGKEKEYYRWDKFHKDIEVYDNKGRYIGSLDPVTGKQYRTGDMQINKILKNILK